MNLLFEPAYAIPPKETLLEVLEERGITLTEFAEVSRIDYTLLEEIVEVKRMISEPVAIKMEEALNIPSSFWLNLETNYQEALKRIS